MAAIVVRHELHRRGAGVLAPLPRLALETLGRRHVAVAAGDEQPVVVVREADGPLKAECGEDDLLQDQVATVLDVDPEAQLGLVAMRGRGDQAVDAFDHVREGKREGLLGTVPRQVTLDSGSGAAVLPLLRGGAVGELKLEAGGSRVRQVVEAGLLLGKGKEVAGLRVHGQRQLGARELKRSGVDRCRNEE